MADRDPDGFGITITSVPGSGTVIECSYLYQEGGGTKVVPCCVDELDAAQSMVFMRIFQRTLKIMADPSGEEAREMLARIDDLERLVGTRPDPDAN